MTTFWTDTELNDRADAQAARLPYLSVHTAVPTAGASEATGGSPAYGRKALIWSPAGDVGPLGASLQPAVAGIAWSDVVTFDLPAGSYTHLGTWSTVTSGTFRSGVSMATVTFTGQDTLAVAVGISHQGL